MYVYNTIQFCAGSVYSPNTTANGIIISIPSVEYYIQWQLILYDDIL